MTLGGGVGAGKILDANLDVADGNLDLDEMQMDDLAADMLLQNYIGNRYSCKYEQSSFVFTHSG
jgi:hypothetical protein